MDHLVEVSPSGRAKCRGCKEAIPKGEVRFGEVYDSAFTGGEALRYWHLKCAAKKLPTQVREALGRYDGDVPDRADVDKAMDEASRKGKAGAKAAFPYADLAPTGRARCLVCEEALEKGQLRVAVERDVESPAGMPIRGAGYLHPACALQWAEDQGEDTDAFADAVIGNSDHLTDAQRTELAGAFR